MSDYDEKISALVDGELSHTDSAVDKLFADEALKARWQRYHLIHDVIHGQCPANPVSIAGKVSKALENEPVVLAPRQWTRYFHPGNMFKQVAGMAVAATVATVAVLTVQQAQLAKDVTQQPASIAAVQQPVVNPDLRTVTANKPQRLRPSVESRLSNYLVQHNEYSASGRIKGVMPYTRIVSVVPGESVAKANR